MKKLALLIGLGFIFNLGQAQFMDSADNGWDNIDLKDVLNQASAPVIVYENKVQFDSIRFSIHRSFNNYKYKVYHYDTLENISSYEIIDFNRFSSKDSDVQDRRIALIDSNGKFLQMIFIDPEL